MTAHLLDGRALARVMTERLRAEAQDVTNEFHQPPGLAVIVSGQDPASAVYVRRKTKVCQQIGIAARTIQLGGSVTTSELIAAVEDLNADPAVHAILVQLPLPTSADERAVIFAVSPTKDVDGFHPENVGRLSLGEIEQAPCTPAGVLALLDASAIPIEGREAVVIGRSQIVGKPMAALLLARHATVTICHSRTNDLPAVCRRADVLVAATGRPWMIDEHYIKPGAVVVDVGIIEVTRETAPPGFLTADVPARIEFETRGTALLGDVRTDHALELASFYTPVPGGVGQMTVAMLAQKTIRMARRQLQQGT